MIVKLLRRMSVFLLLAVVGFISTGLAQQLAPAGTEAVLVIGMTGLKNNAKGKLSVQDGVLTFASSKQKANVSAASIDDVVTGRDSERVLGGTVGTLSRLAPYGGGTALSLLRKKVDTITIEYRDSSGGLHGAIFTMPVGDAESIKQALLAGGAHTTIPTIADAGASSPAQFDVKEQVD